MQENRIAKRYTKALSDIAVTEGKVDAILKDLVAVEDLFSATPEFIHLIKNPRISRQTSEAALSDLLSKLKTGPRVHALILLLARQRRLVLLGTIIQLYKEWVRTHKGELHATLTSVRPLPKKQSDGLKKLLETLTQKSITLNPATDASLLGGMVVKLGCTVMDASLRAQLNRLHLSLKELNE